MKTQVIDMGDIVTVNIKVVGATKVKYKFWLLYAMCWTIEKLKLANNVEIKFNGA
jgi:hypothetical protein